MVIIWLLKSYISCPTVPQIQTQKVKNLNKKILTLFIIILILTFGLNCVSAEEVLNENEIKIKTASEEKTRIGETVKSNENGHYNITFNDGYSRY